MKIVVLAQNPDLYSHRRLKSVALERGHEIDVVPPLRCYMSIASHEPNVYFNGAKLEGYDAVIPRIGASITFYGLAVLRQFEYGGVYPLNDSAAIGRSRDKLRTLQLLARDGLKLPVTTFAHDPKVSRSIVEAAGGSPVLIKLLDETQDIRVVLAETDRSAQTVVEAFRRAKVNILVQQTVRGPEIAGIRALVLGGKVVAATRRSIEPDTGADTDMPDPKEVIEITEAEREAAVAAASSLGLNVCGVDLIRTPEGPLVLDVTSSPSLESIEKTTGIDAANLIIELLENQIQAGSKTNNDIA